MNFLIKLEEYNNILEEIESIPIVVIIVIVYKYAPKSMEIFKFNISMYIYNMH